MWEYFIARLTILITLCLGTLFIVMYPFIKKESIYLARFSVAIGSFVLICCSISYLVVQLYLTRFSDTVSDSIVSN
ncbi:MAG: hypothetical protein H6Q63_137 [Firmicutes bacterium]|nr:hypothetical protein [Bacillota bacterium]